MFRGHTHKHRPIGIVSAMLSTCAVFIFMQTAGFFFAIPAAIAATPIKTPGSGICEVTSQSQRAIFGVKHIHWATYSRNTMPHKVVEDVAQINGGVAYVDNMLGAIVSKVPQKYLTSNADYQPSLAAPVVMATYDPQTAVGAIWIDRALEMPNGDLLVEQLPFSPEDGIVLSYGYDNNNPFWQFVPGARVGGTKVNPTVGNDHAFVKITPNAFFSAVGMIMRQYNAQRGLIATIIARAHKIVHSSGGLIRRRQTVTVKYYAKPQWTFVLPSGEAPGGYTTGYKLPICDNELDKPLIGSSPSNAETKAELWSSNATEAGTSSIKYAGRTWAALTIPSGVEFVKQGVMPVHLATGQWLAYQHSESKSGWGVVALAIFAVALGALVGAAVGALATAISGGGTGIVANASSAFIKALNIFNIGGFNAIAANGYAAGALAGGELGAAGSLLTDTGCFGLCGNGQSASGVYSVSNGAGALVGSGNGMSTNIPIVAYNMNKYLASLYSENVSGGVSNASASNEPTQPSNGWQGVTGALTRQATSSDQLEAAGSLGSQARQTMQRAGSVASQSPSWAKRQQYISHTGNSGAGALPPAP